MASAQLLYNINTTKTIHQSIENQANQANKLSIFPEAEVKRGNTTGYISNTTKNNDNSPSSSCNNRSDSDRNRKQHSSDNKYPQYTNTSSSYSIAKCWWSNKTPFEVEATTATRISSLSSVQEETFPIYQPTATTTTPSTTDTTTSFVFISPENVSKRQQICLDSLSETGRATFVAVPKAMQQYHHQQLQQQQQQQHLPLPTDDVNVAIQWQHFDGSDKSEIETKCCGNARNSSNFIHNNRIYYYRTIQQQPLQQQQQPQAKPYYSTDDVDDNEVLFHNDIEGIEEFNIHTTTTTTTNNTNTKMPVLCNCNNKNNFQQTSDNAFLQQPQQQQQLQKQQQHLYAIAAKSNISIDINNTQQKCCQKSKNVVQNQTSCLNQIQATKGQKSQQHETFNAATATANDTTDAIAPSAKTHFLKKQIPQQQQRNFSPTSNKQTTMFQQSFQGYAAPGATESSTSIVVRFAWDLQRMAKSLLPLLVIFNMLPLFYAGKF